MTVANFWDDLVNAADDEPIEAVIIGAEPRNHRVPEADRGRVLTAERAAELLSYMYDDGFGEPECHAVFVYTPSRVLFVSVYDGATAVEWLPRHPTDGVFPLIAGGY